MGRRRYAAVLAASATAHLALFLVWMASRPPEPFVEPPVMQVTLIAPPRPHEAAKPRPTRPATAPSRLRPVTPSPETPAPPPHVTPPAPAPVAPRVLTEEELLAGRAKDAAQVQAALNRRRLTSPWDGCRQLPGPDGRAAPCPPVPSEQGPALAVRDTSNGGWAGVAAAKRAMHDYRERQSPPGQADAREFPGFNCTLRHRNC